MSDLRDRLIEFFSEPAIFPPHTGPEEWADELLERITDPESELLEALKRIEYGLTQDARTADGWTKADAVACAQAAIAKAEGREP